MTKKPYFPGLNAIRFYAALSVVVYHVEANPHYWFGTDIAPRIPFFLRGWDAVTLFFVLSGFLVTYLLLDEQRRHGDIAVGRFYFRRVLRIFPVYYLVLFVGLLLPLVLSQPAMQFAGRSMDLLAVFTFAANIPFVAGMLPGIIGHLWSIGVEEQFYITWARVVRSRHFPILLGVLFFGKLALNLTASDPIWRSFLDHTRFECMMIGAVVAYALHRRSWMMRALFHPATWLSCLLLVVVVIAEDYGLPFQHHVVMALAFAVLLVNTAANPCFQLRMENRTTTALGNWSYGVYMYHPLVLYVVWQASPGLPLAALLASVIGITLALSALSYAYFERPFLAMKDRAFSAPTVSQSAA